MGNTLVALRAGGAACSGAVPHRTACAQAGKKSISWWEGGGNFGKRLPPRSSS